MMLPPLKPICVINDPVDIVFALAFVALRGA
jgi:hypothetical protein